MIKQKPLHIFEYEYKNQPPWETTACTHTVKPAYSWDSGIVVTAILVENKVIIIIGLFRFMVYGGWWISFP